LPRDPGFQTANLEISFLGHRPTPETGYDVTADGQRFVVITAYRTKSTSITLLTNWPAEIEK
jgi:hypothetical protein